MRSPDSNISVGFGDVFIPTDDPNRELVVTATNQEENFCTGNPMKRFPDGRIALGLPGTVYRSHIERITGTIGLQEIVQGMKNGVYGTINDPVFMEQITRELELESSKPKTLLRSTQSH
jgi:hypothetical protein